MLMTSKYHCQYISNVYTTSHTYINSIVISYTKARKVSCFRNFITMLSSASIVNLCIISFLCLGTYVMSAIMTFHVFSMFKFYFSNAMPQALGISSIQCSNDTLALHNDDQGTNALPKQVTSL